jgi:hypothetical protein
MRDYLGLLVVNLKGIFPSDSHFFKPREECLEELRHISGLDFGDDVDAWEAWVSARKAEIRKKVEAEMEREKGARLFSRDAD